MRTKVWVDGWQMQCCGDPFGVGDTIAWTTTSEVDHGFLASVVGEDVARQVEQYEDHHDLNDGPLSELAGTVEAIEAVSCRYEDRGQALVPMAGTADVEPRTRVDGWEQEDRRSSRPLIFVGYIVSVVGG